MIDACAVCCRARRACSSTTTDGPRTSRWTASPLRRQNCSVRVAGFLSCSYGHCEHVMQHPEGVESTCHFVQHDIMQIAWQRRSVCLFTLIPRPRLRLAPLASRDATAYTARDAEFNKVSGGFSGLFATLQQYVEGWVVQAKDAIARMQVPLHPNSGRVMSHPPKEVLTASGVSGQTSPASRMRVETFVAD